uniref:Sleeping Beauty transposase HTH domain-containing protein n=1 Tax=Neogobius melanostomus TaxID=47308 RepID=A0A8C6UDX0_9GOBI
MVRELTREVRDKAVEKFKAALSYTKISQDLNISRSTVQSIIRKWKEYSTTVNLPRHGIVHGTTISRALHKSGLHGRVARRKPLLKGAAGGHVRGSTQPSCVRLQTLRFQRVRT